MGQVLTTPYTWGLRLHIFWDTQTHRYTDTHTGFLFKISIKITTDCSLFIYYIKKDRKGKKMLKSILKRMHIPIMTDINEQTADKALRNKTKKILEETAEVVKVGTATTGGMAAHYWHGHGLHH